MAAQDEVRARLSGLLGGVAVSALRPLEGGSSSRAYALDADGRALVVKVNDNHAVIANAVETLQVLAGLGVPVPELVAHEQGIVVMELVPGRDLGRVLAELSREQLTALAERIVAIQRLVAVLPSPGGCGFVGVHEVATRDWADVVRHPGWRGLPDPLPADSADLVARLHAVIDLAEPLLAAVVPVCFLDDLTTKNVMVADGSLAGVVDCDVVCHGDPLFHLALTAAAVHTWYPADCAFYVEELSRLSGVTDPELPLLALYQAVFCTQFLTNGEVQGAARATTLDRAYRLLDLVESRLG